MGAVGVASSACIGVAVETVVARDANAHGRCLRQRPSCSDCVCGCALPRPPAPVCPSSPSLLWRSRPNKDEDTCYSFWIGGALHLLGQGQLVDPKAVACFAQCCEGARGGVSKVRPVLSPAPSRPAAALPACVAAAVSRLSFLDATPTVPPHAMCRPTPHGSQLPGAHPDILHSYFALAGLALTGHPGLRALDPRFGISERARKEAGLRPFAADDRRDGQSSDVVNVCEPCNDSDVPAPA